MKFIKLGNFPTVLLLNQYIKNNDIILIMVRKVINILSDEKRKDNVSLIKISKNKYKLTIKKIKS